MKKERFTNNEFVSKIKECYRNYLHGFNKATDDYRKSKKDETNKPCDYDCDFDTCANCDELPF